MKDVEPLQPAEYILKGVVNAAYGQEHNSVKRERIIFVQNNRVFDFSVIMSKQRNRIFN